MTQDHITQSTDPVIIQQIKAEKPSLDGKTSLGGKTTSRKTKQHIFRNIQTYQHKHTENKKIRRISLKYRERNNLRGSILDNKN